MSKNKLAGGKTLSESKTVRSNILSILATIGTIAAILHGGADPGVMIPALATAAGTLYGNIMSIIHRRYATERIIPSNVVF